MISKSVKGFTLIELLVVIVAIGASAGVMMSVINSGMQKRRAEDSAHRSNLNDYSQAIETYKLAEGMYPQEGTAQNPLDSSAATSAIASSYIAEWLPGYRYRTNAGLNAFSIQVTKSSDTRVYKYYSGWGNIRECGPTTSATIMNDCD